MVVSILKDKKIEEKGAAAESPAVSGESSDTESLAVGEESVVPEVKITIEKGRYVEAVGKRKTSVARVRLFQSSKMSFVVNGKELEKYFPTKELQNIVHESLSKVKAPTFMISALIKGGGVHSQAEAMRHGISRVLVALNADFRKKLKRAGFLKRDPRAKERKKPGLKKARKAPQWSKR